MFVSHRKNIPGKKIESDATRFVTKQVLVGPAQGWKDYVMRLFTLEKEGYAPRHSHDWQHILYVVEGEGNLFLDGEDHMLTPGSTAYIPNGAEHQISNSGDGKFVFMCIVPKHGDV